MESKSLNPDSVKKKLGFKRRFWVHTPGTPFTSVEATSADLMVYAGKQALDNANLKANDIDLMIAATITPARYASSMSTLVGGKMGLVCASFEMRMGCASGLYALMLAYQNIKAGANHVLITTAETTSKIASPGTIQVYGAGDGGAALVLSKCRNKASGLVTSYVNSDGSYAENMCVPGLLPPNIRDIEQENYFLRLTDQADDFLKEKWREVPSILYRNSGLVPSDIDCIIPHQVNKSITSLAIKAAGIKEEKAINIVSEYANCGCVGIYNAIHLARQQGKLASGKQLMLAAVGGGVSWGGMILNC